jgi:broad specificity phosphatase PhoE
MNEKTLFMIRHGRLINSHDGILNGQSDTPLTAEGFEETMAWKSFFQSYKIDLILSSDLQRTFLPAAKYSEILKCIHKSFKELREIDAGKWELKKVTELIEKDRDNFFKRTQDPVNVPFPDGENLSQLKRRVKKCIDKFIKSEDFKRILYIGHGGVIKVIVLAYLGIPLKNFFKFEIDHASLTVLRFFEDGNVTLKVFNSKYEMEL